MYIKFETANMYDFDDNILTPNIFFMDEVLTRNVKTIVLLQIGTKMMLKILSTIRN